MACSTSFLACVHRPDDPLQALVVGDEALVPLVLDLVDEPLVPLQDAVLLLRHDDVVLADGDAGPGGGVEADPLEGVQQLAHELRRVAVHVGGDEGLDLALLQHVVDVLVLLGVVGVPEVVPQGLLDVLVEQDAPERRLHPPAVPADDDLVVDLERALLVGGLGLVVGGEVRLDLGLLEVLPGQGDVVEPENHVLGRHRDREPVRRQQDVLRREHQDPRLRLGLRAQGDVDRHLVAVEVRVERGAHQRVDLDGLALDQHRLEGLDAEPVQRRRAVQEHRVLLDHVLQHVPHLGPEPLDHLLGAPDVRRQRPVHEHLHDERLEQLDRHEARQAALVHLQARTDHDDRTARVVDALAEQVLAEATLLALEHVRERS